MKTTENILFKILIALIIPLLVMGVYGFSINQPTPVVETKTEIVKLPTVVIVGKRVHDTNH